jgi:hypothetical protein
VECGRWPQDGEASRHNIQWRLTPRCTTHIHTYTNVPRGSTVGGGTGASRYSARWGAGRCAGWEPGDAPPLPPPPPPRGAGGAGAPRPSAPLSSWDQPPSGGGSRDVLALPRGGGAEQRGYRCCLLEVPGAGAGAGAGAVVGTGAGTPAVTATPAALRAVYGTQVMHALVMSTLSIPAECRYGGGYQQPFLRMVRQNSRCAEQTSVPARTSTSATTDSCITRRPATGDGGSDCGTAGQAPADNPTAVVHHMGKYRWGGGRGNWKNGARKAVTQPHRPHPTHTTGHCQTPTHRTHKCTKHRTICAPRTKTHSTQTPHTIQQAHRTPHTLHPTPHHTRT